MNIDLILSFVCAGLSAAVIAFILIRTAVDGIGGFSGGASSIRVLLAFPAAIVARRRNRDPDLNRAIVRLDKMVVQSGGKFLDGASAEEIFVARFILPLFAFAIIIPLGLLLKLSGGVVLLATVFFAVLLYAYPETALKSAAEERARKFTHDLPGSLDVMRLVAQSGGDLLSAIRSVIEVSPRGPVRDELARAVAEVAIGTSLATALNHIAERVNTNEANAVFSTLAQSLEMGTSVTDNLQSASSLIRHTARVRAQAQAQKAVVNMSFPLLLLILPGIFIVLFAPLVIQYMHR